MNGTFNNVNLRSFSFLQRAGGGEGVPEEEEEQGKKTHQHREGGARQETRRGPV
jgi:hypothetical protein